MKWVGKDAFRTVMTISWEKETRSRHYVLPLSNEFNFLYVEKYHEQHYTLQSLEQFGALYAQPRWQTFDRPGFEPSRPDDEDTGSQ